MSYSTLARSLPPPVGTVIRPPVRFLYLAIASVALSVALLVPASVWLSVVGYLVSPFVAAAGIAIYRAIDIRRQASVWYIANPGQRRLAALTLIASFIVGGVHAWIIATEIAKALSG